MDKTLLKLRLFTTGDQVRMQILEQHEDFYNIATRNVSSCSKPELRASCVYLRGQCADRKWDIASINTKAPQAYIEDVINWIKDALVAKFEVW